MIFFFLNEHPSSSVLNIQVAVAELVGLPSLRKVFKLNIPLGIIHIIYSVVQMINARHLFMVAIQFCGCLMDFLRYVRLSLYGRSRILRNHEHFSAGHRTERTSAVLSSYSFLASSISSAIWQRMIAYRESYDKKSYVWCKQRLNMHS